jgi:hypothetical protein
MFPSGTYMHGKKPASTFISHTNMHYIQHDCIVEMGLGSMRKRWFGAPVANMASHAISSEFDFGGS